MSEYFWDSQIEYLKRTRDLYYNDDYLEFLVKSVWRINQVVLNEYTWLRYNNEIVSGIKISDEEFLNKVKKQYGFSFKLDQFDFTKPSLFFLGRQDSTVGYKDALNLTDKYSRGTFTVLDTAGHNLQIDQPQIFNNVVNEWLDRVLNDFLSRKSES